MNETKVQIGDDVLLDIGTHSDWYISEICYDNESVNLELRRKTERNNKWWIANADKICRYINELQTEETQDGTITTMNSSMSKQIERDK